MKYSGNSQDFPWKVTSLTIRAVKTFQGRLKSRVGTLIQVNNIYYTQFIHRISPEVICVGEALLALAKFMLGISSGSVWDLQCKNRMEEARFFLWLFVLSIW